MKGIIVSHILASSTIVWSWRSNVLLQQTLMIRCLFEQSWLSRLLNFECINRWKMGARMSSESSNWLRLLAEFLEYTNIIRKSRTKIAFSLDLRTTKPKLNTLVSATRRVTTLSQWKLFISCDTQASKKYLKIHFEMVAARHRRISSSHTMMHGNDFGLPCSTFNGQRFHDKRRHKCVLLRLHFNPVSCLQALARWVKWTHAKALTHTHTQDDR